MTTRTFVRATYRPPAARLVHVPRHGDVAPWIALVIAALAAGRVVAW